MLCGAACHHIDMSCHQLSLYFSVLQSSYMLDLGRCNKLSSELVLLLLLLSLKKRSMSVSLCVVPEKIGHGQWCGADDWRVSSTSNAANKSLASWDRMLGLYIISIYGRMLLLLLLHRPITLCWLCDGCVACSVAAVRQPMRATFRGLFVVARVFAVCRKQPALRYRISAMMLHHFKSYNILQCESLCWKWCRHFWSCHVTCN